MCVCCIDTHKIVIFFEDHIGNKCIYVCFHVLSSVYLLLLHLLFKKAGYECRTRSIIKCRSPGKVYIYSKVMALKCEMSTEVPEIWEN